MTSKNGSASRAAAASGVSIRAVNQDGVSAEPETLAGRAFDDLRGEVALLRRAIEQLLTERQQNETPDYTPTLAATAVRLEEIGKFMGAVARSPAMRLTPEIVAQQLETGMQSLRAGDRDNLDQATVALRTSIATVDAVIEQAWTADRQNRWLLGTGLVSALAGMLLCSVLPGAFARALPDNWHVPEKIAARVLRLDMKDAGERMIAVARSRETDRAQKGQRTGPIAPAPSRAPRLP